MTTPHKRVVVVRLSPRDKNDPKAILDAVREALRQKEMELRVCNAPEEHLDPPETVRRVALEQLEAAAITVATKVLDEKAREIEQGQAGAKGQAPPPPAAIPQARKGLVDWLGKAAKASWVVTVGAVLDWVKKQVTGS
jgi:hypothetical protein